jgi:hypothetical protein
MGEPKGEPMGEPKGEPMGESVAPDTAIAVPRAVPIPPVTATIAPKTAVIAPVTDVVTPTAPAPAPPVVENDRIKGIITDLEAKGIIQGVEPLSFRLDKHGMTVNGVKVSDEVFAFFKDKYVTNPRNRFSYSHQGGSTSSTVWVY